MTDETRAKVLNKETSLDERVAILVGRIEHIKIALKFSTDHGLELNAQDQKAIIRGLRDAYFIITGEVFPKEL